jgi:serine/threonine protein kinase
MLKLSPTFRQRLPAMSLCINPGCAKPQNSDDDLFCQSCGSELLMEGRYRVTRMLGAGGCGKTYEVNDRAGGFKVLKVLVNNDPKYVELFQREAFLLSQLSHPGIPKVEADAYFVYGSGHLTEPLHCLVMEKIVGLDLQKYLRQRGHPIEQKMAIQWMIQLSYILQTVHHQDVLHRDIKPSNIMLKADGNLALVDFGTARSITNIYANAEGRIPATRIISALYTPDEQIKGHPVPQSDFFALGRTFVYLLTAKDLSEFYNPITADFIWQDAVPSLAPRFVAFIENMMAPLPVNRPASAGEVLHQLKGLEQEIYPPLNQPVKEAYAPTQLTPKPPVVGPSSQPNTPAHPASNPSAAHPPIQQAPAQPPSHPTGWTNATPVVPAYPPSQPSSPRSGAPSGSSPPTRPMPQKFLQTCQQELAECIGPIASILCQRTLAQRPEWAERDFVEALAAHIQDAAAARQFRQRLLP